VALAVDQVDEDVVKNVALYAQAELSPMASVVGGIVAQEAIKFTGKPRKAHSND